MRCRTKFIVGGIALALLALAVCLAFPPRKQPDVLTFGVDGTRHGAHPGANEIIMLDTNTLLPDNFIAMASFTNNGRIALELLPPTVEWHISNIPRAHAGETWRGMWTPTGRLPSVRLPPKSVAELPIDSPLPKDMPPRFRPDKLRFVFDYTADAGLVRRGVSHLVGKVPAKLMPKRTADWLLTNGFVDGQLHGHFEGPWLAYPIEKPAEREAP